VSGETIRLSNSLRLAVGFLNVMYLTDKHTVACNFIIDLLCTGRSSSVRSQAFLGFRKLIQIAKHGARRKV
jgi:hypothetical protein